MRIHKAVVLLLAYVVLAGLTLRAQTGATATILGVVTDPSSAIVVGAKVVAVNSETGFRRKVETGADGQFVIFSLPIGPYDVRVEAVGFRTFETKGVVLTIDQRARVDVQLTVGAINETVTVSGEATLLNTDDSSLSQVVTQKAVFDLPLNGRNFIQLTRLSASVNSGDGYSSDQAAGSVYGQRNSNNQFRLDGIETTELTGNRSRLAPSIDAIQEFTLIKGLYPAEYGKVAGGTINVAVRSGTNDYHGTAFEFLRNDKLNARNFFDQTGGPPNLRRNQFGGVFGGPVRKDKTFFFFSYDGVQERRASIRTTKVPTPEQIAGDLSGIGKNMMDPLTSAPFPNNRIPAARIHRISKALSAFWPTPNNPADPARNYISSGSEAIGANQYLARVDHSLTSKDQLFVRYAYAKSDDNQAPLVGDFADRILDTSQGAVLGHTHNFGANLLNEARFGYTRIKFAYAERHSYPTFPTEADIPGVTRDPKYAGVPNTAITGYAGLGTGGSRPFFKTQNNFEFVDNLMYHSGRHTIKTGVNLLRRQAQQLVPLTKKGILTFDGNFVGDTLGDFLLGLPRQTQLGSSPYVSEADLRTSDVYAYVQDDWRILPRLTLNLGLRYEYVDPPTSLHGMTTNINPYTGVLTPPPLTPGKKLFNADLNNFAPRVGFALRPFGGTKTVMRGGYGIFYNSNNYDEYFYMPYNPPFGNVLLYQSLPNKPTLSLDNPFPATGGTMGAPKAYGVDPDFRIGYVQFFTFGVQQEIARDTTVELSYVGSKSTRLAKGYDMNYAPPGPGAVASRRVITPNLSNIFAVFASSNATYHSLQAQLERRFSKGLLLLTSYAFGKTLDDISNSQGEKGQSTIQDPRCANSCEKGIPTYARAQRFTFNLIYQLPVGKGRRFLNTGGVANAVLGGWEIGSMFTKQSGAPLTATISGDPMNVGLTNQTRANYLGGAIRVDNPTLNRYFNTAVFAAPAPYMPGNLGRGTFTGPSPQTLDFAIYKSFNISDRHRLQLRGEFFNLSNHPNWGNPGTTFGTTSFGKITGSSGARESQVALKYNF